MTEPDLDLFAVSAPGLSSVVREELIALGCHGVERVKGGVEFKGDLETIAEVNQWARTPTRLLLRLATFKATSLPVLLKRSGKVDWPTYFTPGLGVRVRATCRKSRIYHSGAAEQRVLQAIVDHSEAKAGSPDEDAQDVLVRIDHDTCTLSIDTSGELLHRRGYRLDSASAPLRETLGAGILYLAGWKPQMPLVDPFCGTGTFAIEAASVARGLPVGALRSFAYGRWPCAAHLGNANPRDIDHPMPSIQASDICGDTLTAAQSNAARAEVAGDITFSTQGVRDVRPLDKSGLLVANPPYGSRIGRTHDLSGIYEDLGETARTHFRGWRIALLTSQPKLAKATGIKFAKTHNLTNGGINVKLYLTTL